ncbi:hypothetical protein EB001_02710 [bacterium]|nr:hypothetical protein [bacterium]
MKKLIISTLAVLALTATANATDLPNKKKAPEAAKPVAAEAAKPAASNDSLSVSYGQDLGNNFGAKVDDAYGVTYKHNLGGGFSVSGVASTTQVSGALLKQNLEVQAGYALPAFSGVTVSGKVGVGERFATTNFPYYALYGAADYKLVDGLTLNAINYRYRNAFDTTNAYESHRLGTGVTYDITSNYSVGLSVTRSYDTNWNATGDAVTGAFTVKF